jgi:signal transduction histidine kinase
MVLAGLAFVVCELATFRTGVARNLGAQSEIIGFNGASALLFNDRESAVQTMSALHVRPDIRTAAIYNAGGHLFAEWTRSGSAQNHAPADLSSSVAETTFSKDTVELFHPIVLDGNRIGTVYIRSGLAELKRRLTRDLIVILVVLMASFLIAAGVSLKIGERISAPVLALARTAKTISEKKDYGVRAEMTSHDEVGELVSTFNEMLGEIQANGEALTKANDELERRVNERTAQLEVANKELESFSYSVSHDLRAPLRSIDGFSQALLEDCADKLEPQNRDYLQRIRARSQQMAQLIDDLLNLARMTRKEMKLAEVDLSAVARQIIKDLRERDPGREVEARITDGVVVTADPALIKIALENLLWNAWKFSTKQPHAVIEFGTHVVPEGTGFFVRDNGAGFDMAYVDKLFGAFQRLHGADEFPGTGVGLATVRRIISRHGGRVWAEGKPGEGAAFFVTLPR